MRIQYDTCNRSLNKKNDPRISWITYEYKYSVLIDEKMLFKVVKKSTFIS